MNFDRSADVAGSVLGPFLKAGHPTQSQKPSASFTDEEVVALANFLRQRVNDTMRGSPLFTVGDIVTGDAKAGEAYFNGDGECATCHNATDAQPGGRVDADSRTRRSAAAHALPDGRRTGTRPRRTRGPACRGVDPAAAAQAQAAADRNAVKVTIAPASGAPMSGVLVEESDFYVTLRESDGTVRVVRRAPGMKITKTNPMQAHIDLLDRVSDKQIHDLVAYLETLK